MHSFMYASFTTCHGENESNPSTGSHRGHRHHACDATVSPVSWNLAPRQLGLESRFPVDGSCHLATDPFGEPTSE